MQHAESFLFDLSSQSFGLCRVQWQICHLPPQGSPLILIWILFLVRGVDILGWPLGAVFGLAEHTAQGSGRSVKKKNTSMASHSSQDTNVAERSAPTKTADKGKGIIHEVPKV